ncbi:MAG TPA: hypothetical protein VMH47_08360 [Gaiellaceae bacterium]|nr:hypothetical protein [Gaiellaceae bacterium]
MPTAAAPRIDRRLLRLIERRAGSHTAAELTRLAGDFANTLGLVRPSYQQVRVIRLRYEAKPRAATGVSTLAVACDVFFWNARPAYDLVNYLAGDPLPYRIGAVNAPRRGS